MLMMFKSSAVVRSLLENLLLILILVGAILGLLIGFILNEKVQESKDPSPKEVAMYISFPGELFLRMLGLLILPLLVSSVIGSLAVLDKKLVGKLGKLASIYFLITTFGAVVLTVVLTSALKPGVRKINDEIKSRSGGYEKASHAILDLVRNIIPDNIVEASSSSTVTKYKKHVFVKSARQHNNSTKNTSALLPNMVVNPSNISNGSFQIVQENAVAYDYDGLAKYNSANLLGILFFSVVFGVTLSMLGEEAKLMAKWFRCLFKVTIKMVDIFMWFSPVGICSIIAGKLASMDNIKGEVERLGMFIAVVIMASFIYAIVILPAVYFVIVRKNPFRLLARVTEALLIAFGTASSASSIPIAIKCLEEKHKVDHRVVQFVLPIGTTVNKDGMGIYTAAMAIFIAQNQLGSNLSFGSSIVVCFAATLASIAAVAIPASGPIATATIILQAIGIRSADIALVLSVDWILDRITGSVSVWGNCVASVILEYLSHDDLRGLDYEKDPAGNSLAAEEFEIGISMDIAENEEQNEADAGDERKQDGLVAVTVNRGELKRENSGAVVVEE